MSEKKSSVFFRATIARTKQREIEWAKISMRASLSFPECDTDRSYSAKYENAQIFLIRKMGEIDVSCWVKPDPTLGLYLIGENDDPDLLRLYNIVHNKFPSIDKFIDSFIAGYQ